MAQPQGESAGYYNYQSPPQPGYQPQAGYQQQQTQEMKSGYAPPTYGQDFHMAQDNKQTFEQTFKIEKPKLNDLWAGILACNHTSCFFGPVANSLPPSSFLSSSASPRSQA
jgi:hypothetical protein